MALRVRAPCQKVIYRAESIHVVNSTGEMHLQLEDAAGKPVGEPFILNPGDIARVDKDTKMRWSSPTSGKGMFPFYFSASVDQSC